MTGRRRHRRLRLWILIHTKREARDAGLVLCRVEHVILIHTKREARDFCRGERDLGLL